MELVAFWFICGIVGAVIGSTKRMGLFGGFVLGLLLGPVGVIVALVMPGRTSLQQVTARPDTAGWHPDPLGRFDGRYFDGRAWTQHVGRVGADGVRQQFEDPL